MQYVPHYYNPTLLLFFCVYFSILTTILFYALRILELLSLLQQLYSVLFFKCQANNLYSFYCQRNIFSSPPIPYQFVANHANWSLIFLGYKSATCIIFLIIICFLSMLKTISVIFPFYYDFFTLLVINISNFFYKEVKYIVPYYIYMYHPCQLTTCWRMYFTSETQYNKYLNAPRSFVIKLKIYKPV